jgi:conjugative relaxase-like TrwC/TraI family protein
MLSISNPIHGAKAVNYYLGFTGGDYYLDGADGLGFWHGGGAMQLRLSGAVTRAQLSNLFAGYSPDGKDSLVMNAGKDSRVSGWDFTLSAPKSVSVLWSQLPPDLREKVEAAHQTAVLKALRFLELNGGLTRRGKEGKRFEHVGLVVADFLHAMSRALDPQLHTHLLILNLCLRRDGTTGSIWTKRLFELKMAAGAIYQAELARQLQETLKLVIERTANGFEVTGVDKDLIQEFSKRRKEIENVLKALGLDGAIASKVAALDTRQKKKNVPLEALMPEWQRIGKEFGFGPKEAEELVGKLRQSQEKSPELIVSETANRLIREQGAFSERDLIRESARASIGTGVGGKIVSAVYAELRRKEYLLTSSVDFERVFTTKSLKEEWKQLETELLEVEQKAQPDIKFCEKELLRVLSEEEDPTACKWKFNADTGRWNSFPDREYKESNSRRIYGGAELARYVFLGFMPTRKASEILAKELGVPTRPEPLKESEKPWLKIEKGEKSLFKRRTSLPHLEIWLPRYQLQIRNPILIYDTRKKTEWPVLRKLLLARIWGAKLVLVIDTNPKPGIPIEWLMDFLKRQKRTFQITYPEITNRKQDLAPLPQIALHHKPGVSL